MAAVSLAQVSRHFGAFKAIDNIDLEIADQTLCVIVGPSGSGKSTLLRVVAGLDELSSGTIRMDDLLVTQWSPKQRNVSMVFQDHALYPHMTAFENMAFSLRLAGTSHAQIRDAVQAAARALEIDTLLDRFPSQLSGGQRQRVAIGRAIVRRPRVHLFDEPLSSLDARLRETLRSRIKALQRELKTTLLYVTHDQSEAMALADHLVVMHNGRIAQQGRPFDVYDHPASRFVAEFLGSPPMSFLQGRLTSMSPPAWSTLDGAILPLPSDAPHDLSVLQADDAVLGVRPEHWVHDPEGLRFRVTDVEVSGLDTVVTCSTGRSEIKALVRARAEIRAGEQLTLSARRIHGFDAGGKRLM